LTDFDPYLRSIHPLLIVLSGPSGVGKDSVLRGLKERGLPFRFVPTMNTRPRRPDEVDGVDYFFVTTEQFITMLEQGELLEHAMVYGDYKGIPKGPVREALASGQDVILRVDVQGAATIRAKAAEDPELGRALVSVFLTPPTLAVLEERLRKRNTDTEAVIQRRLAVARQEIAQWKHYDYLLISGTIPEDLRRMQVIIEAEKMRRDRSPAPEC